MLAVRRSILTIVAGRSLAAVSVAATAKRQHSGCGFVHGEPPSPPPSPVATGIFVMNNLTKAKGELNIRSDRPFTWYQCGPTVYDSAHLGHACTYVRFDIIRRILERYFRVNVYQVLGMTDIDDKIINKALARNESWLALARTYEAEFLREMRTLGVLPPSTIVRVSEHIPEILAFIEGILARGHGYTTDDGSVYFDTAAFGDRYGKLQPKRQQDNSTQGGAGDAEERGKRSAKDFALWKSAKPNEPSWESPWGQGRPGWHIECSAMGSSVFGSHMDLHTGGIDLMFPHHENELAQSESFHAVDSWVHTFLHSGHLWLHDTKMSKSLGNVISIKSFLSEYTPSQFRFFCLQTKYSSSLNYNKASMDKAVALQARMADFFKLVSHAEKTAAPSAPRKLGEADYKLLQALHASKAEVDAALRDDFDTPRAIASLSSLIALTNGHLNRPVAPPLEPVGEVARYVADTLGVFGISDLHDTVVWPRDSPSSPSSAATPESANGIPAQTARILDAATLFRAQVRETGLALLKTPCKPQGVSLLAACDTLRTSLRAEAVAIKDLPNGTSMWEKPQEGSTK